jgi:dephospho-CoA kinase
MRKIGLTGGIGSGKSEAARILRGLGAVVIEADLVGHDTYRRGRPAWHELRREFGEGILAADGEIDRHKLGRLVFADAGKRHRLEAILWPRMKKAIAEGLSEAERAGSAVAVLEAAVLLEAGWDSLVDEVWVIEAPEGRSMEQLRVRTGWNEQEVRQRVAAQMPNTERRARATLVIWNDGDLATLERRVRAAWKAPGKHGAARG